MPPGQASLAREPEPLEPRRPLPVFCVRVVTREGEMLGRLSRSRLVWAILHSRTSRDTTSNQVCYSKGDNKMKDRAPAMPNGSIAGKSPSASIDSIDSISSTGSAGCRSLH
jgi:hypothetical protein